jgi:hypothetical protein
MPRHLADSGHACKSSAYRSPSLVLGARFGTAAAATTTIGGIRRVDSMGLALALAAN